VGPAGQIDGIVAGTGVTQLARASGEGHLETARMGLLGAQLAQDGAHAVGVEPGDVDVGEH